LFAHFADTGHYASCQHKFCTLDVHFPVHVYDHRKLHIINLKNTIKSGSWLESVHEVRGILYRGTFFTGHCIPYECSTREVNTLLTEVAKNYQVPVKFELKCGATDGQDSELTTLNISRRIAQFVWISTIIVTLTSSIFVQTTSSSNQYIRSFSLVDNLGHFLRQSDNQQAENLRFLNGIRFIYFVCVLFTHYIITGADRVMSPMLRSLANLRTTSEFEHHFFGRFSQWFIMIPVSMLSSFLAYRHWHSELDRNRGIHSGCCN